MDILFYHFQKRQWIIEFLDKSQIEDGEYPRSSIISMQRCIRNNPDKFTKEEIQFLNELLNNAENDYSNRIIAFEIIKSK